MHPKKIENVLALNPEQKYSYFISTVAENEAIWGLFNEGWASTATKENEIVLPFWPEAEFAKRCCKDQWQDYSPQLITLNDFLGKWLPGMAKDKSLAGIFFSDEKAENIIVSPTQLKADVELELEKFF